MLHDASDAPHNIRNVKQEPTLRTLHAYTFKQLKMKHQYSYHTMPSCADDNPTEGSAAEA